MYIYKTTCLVNNKIYIGKSHRYINSYIGGGKYLRKAIKRYGKQNFKKEIIEDHIESEEKLNERERHWIAFYNSTNRKIGYNKSEGGDGNSGERSLETRRKLSQPHPTAKGDKHYLYGKHIPKETRDKMSISNKKAMESQEQRDKLSEVLIGVKHGINTTTSRYVGVSYDISKNKWRAKITVDKKVLCLGDFPTEVEAALAYNEAMSEFYGWKSHLNIIAEEDVRLMWEMKLEEKRPGPKKGALNGNYGKHMSQEIKDKHSVGLLGIKKRTKPTTSKYVGVHLKENKYCALINVYGKRIYLGSFKTETEAAMAYNEAAEYYYGYKAKLNKITEEEINALWEMDI